MTATPESEYSPTVTPVGALSVVRVELDAANTQRLWQFTPTAASHAARPRDVKPVGYHAWADDQTLALFILGQPAPATLQIADTAHRQRASSLATDIGRSIQRIPAAARRPPHISFVQRERDGDGVSLDVKELDPATGAIAVADAGGRRTVAKPTARGRRTARC